MKKSHCDGERNNIITSIMEGQIMEGEQKEFIYTRKTDPSARIPMKMTLGAAGFDLYAVEPATIPPNSSQSIKTGIAIQIPENYYGAIRGRSRNAFNHEVLVFNGTIDADYRGEISVLMLNTSKDKPFVVKQEDRIAQIILTKIHTAIHLVENEDNIKPTKRGSAGFGSTGK